MKGKWKLFEVTKVEINESNTLNWNNFFLDKPVKYKDKTSPIIFIKKNLIRVSNVDTNGGWLIKINFDITEKIGSSETIESQGVVSLPSEFELELLELIKEGRNEGLKTLDFQLHFYSMQYPTEFAELEKNLIELNKERELKRKPKKEQIEISDLVSLLVKKNDKLKNTQTFLIKQALKLSEDKTEAEEKLQQSETTLQTLAQENLFLNKQNQLQAQTITDLEAQIKTLQELANSELKSKNRQNTKLSDKNEDLEESLLKKIGGLVEEQNKTKKLTRVNKVRALIVEKLKSDLTNLKSELQTAQTEIKSLKIDKHHLEEQISLKKASKKDLYAKIRELKSSKKDQEQELTTSKEKITNQEKTIQQLETEKTNWTQEKGKWEQEKQQFLTKQNELLTEIELLKNPPVQGDNKETLKESMVVKEIIKEIIIKDLESNNLGLNLTSSEKTKLNNLTLSEIENYRNQLVKDKFNQLEKENKQLSRNGNKEVVIQRERERESNSLNIDWLVSSYYSCFQYEKD